MAVVPVILVSRIGAMLAVMTNRLSRVIDRARILESGHAVACGVQVDMKAEETGRRRLGPMLAAGVGLLIALPLNALQRPVPDEPPIPYIDIGACPFEGCVYREWEALAPVVARQERRADAAVAFNVNNGERVTAITGVVVTMRPGRVRFRRQVALDSSSEILHIEPGQTLFLMTYQGEGFTRAWFQGRFYNGVDASQFLNGRCETDPDQCAGEILERPQSVWWVQIRNAKGQVGWTDAPDRFDGKDALAN